MKRPLWERPVDRVAYGGKTYRLRPAFRRVLQCYRVMGETLLPEMQRIGMCLQLLLRPLSRLRLPFLDGSQKTELFQRIFQELVDTGEKKSSGPRTFDFDQDAGPLYAAFYQCYGLDLLGRDRNLHWWKFVQLFSGLPEDTRMMQIVSIRSRPLPKPTKYNAEERQNLLRLKSAYRLVESDQQRREHMQESLGKMAVMLEGLAHDKN